MSAEPFIRQCYPVQGDWFVVRRRAGDPAAGADRWWIDRVVLWAAVEADRQVSHVRAIDGEGQPNLREDGQDSYFVLGSDRSPAGATWKEVYDQAPPSVLNVREITALMNACAPAVG